MFMLQLSCCNFFIMKMFERRKSNNRETFAKHVTRQNQNTQVFLKTSQYWSLLLVKLQAFFYRTPVVASSGISRQQILFSAEFGIFCCQLHRFLFRTSLKIRVKSQNQPLELFCKKWRSQKSCRFHRKRPMLKSACNVIKRYSNTDMELRNL